MEKRTVKLPHKASYVNPINVSQGELIELSGKIDVWDGHRWLWTVSEDGREGWVPDDLVDEHASKITASRDYSAMELTCDENELLEVHAQSHGWVWCANIRGEQGWVPLKNLQEI